MKAIKTLILILTMMLTKTPSHAQFNTIGYVKKHSISKKKSPQETTHVASVDSVMKADSLPPDSSQDVLPYLRASFPLKNIQINSRFGMRNHPVKHKTIMHNGVDLAAHYEKVFSMFSGEVTMSLGYGKQKHPHTGESFFHHGVDFKVRNYLLSAVATGKVTGLGNDAIHGIYQITRYDDYEVTYAHLSNVFANYGKEVKAGQVIAVSADSLHVEVKYKGEETGYAHDAAITQSINP
jgi:murein DD-endopeptidase MepM/ murein hydrolase activator NlpD